MQNWTSELQVDMKPPHLPWFWHVDIGRVGWIGRGGRGADEPSKNKKISQSSQSRSHAPLCLTVSESLWKHCSQKERWATAGTRKACQGACRSCSQLRGHCVAHRRSCIWNVQASRLTSAACWVALRSTALTPLPHLELGVGDVHLSQWCNVFNAVCPTFQTGSFLQKSGHKTKRKTGESQI